MVDTSKLPPSVRKAIEKQKEKDVSQDRITRVIVPSRGSSGGGISSSGGAVSYEESTRTPDDIAREAQQQAQTDAVADDQRPKTRAELFSQKARERYNIKTGGGQTTFQAGGQVVAVGQSSEITAPASDNVTLRTVFASDIRPSQESSFKGKITDEPVPDLRAGFKGAQATSRLEVFREPIEKTFETRRTEFADFARYFRQEQRLGKLDTEKRLYNALATVGVVELSAASGVSSIFLRPVETVKSSVLLASETGTILSAYKINPILGAKQQQSILSSRKTQLGGIKEAFTVDPLGSSAQVAGTVLFFKGAGSLFKITKTKVGIARENLFNSKIKGQLKSRTGKPFSNARVIYSQKPGQFFGTDIVSYNPRQVFNKGTVVELTPIKKGTSIIEPGAQGAVTRGKIQLTLGEGGRILSKETIKPFDKVITRQKTLTETEPSSFADIRYYQKTGTLPFEPMARLNLRLSETQVRNPFPKSTIQKTLIEDVVMKKYVYTESGQKVLAAQYTTKVSPFGDLIGKQELFKKITGDFKTRPSLFKRIKLKGKEFLADQRGQVSLTRTKGTTFQRGGGFDVWDSGTVIKRPSLGISKRPTNILPRTRAGADIALGFTSISALSLGTFAKSRSRAAPKSGVLPKTFQGIKPATDTGIKPGQLQGTLPRQTPRQQQRQGQRTDIPIPSFPGLPGTGTPSRPGKPKPPVLTPKLPPLFSPNNRRRRINSRRRTKSTPFFRPFQYTSSFRATEFNIFGKMPKVQTGVSLRPLISKRGRL